MSDVKYTIRMDAELSDLRRARAEWAGFLGDLKAGVGIGIGSSIAQQIGRIPAAFKEAMDAGMQYRMRIEDLQTSFTSLLGSQGAAINRVNALSRMAAKTPFELPGIAQASKILQTLTGDAMAVGEGLTMVGDMAAVADRPIEEVAMHVGRLYDALQSGRPAGEAAMQLQQLGVMSGVTRNKIEGLQKAGKSGAEVWAVAASSFGRFAGEMERRSQTLSGRISTFHDAWNAAMAEMMKGAAGVKGGAMEELAKAMEKPETIQALRAMGAEIGKITKALADLSVWAANNADKLKQVADAVVAIGKAWATYKIGQIVTGAAAAIPGMLSGGGGKAAAGAAGAAGGASAGAGAGAMSSLLGKANVALAVGMAVKSLIDSQTNEIDAQNAAWKDLTSNLDIANKGYRQQIESLSSVSQKQALIQQLDEAIAQAREESSKPGQNALIASALDAQITRLQTLRKLTLQVADAELQRKETEAKAARNREANELAAAEFRAKNGGKKDVRERIAAVQDEMQELSKAAQKRALLATMAAGGSEKDMEKIGRTTEMDTLDQQMAVLKAKIAEFKKELATIDLSDLAKDPKIFEKDLERSAELKKAIPDLQNMLDGLEVSKLKVQWEQMQVDLKKTEHALKDSIPNAGTVARAGMFGRGGVGGAGMRAFLGLDNPANQDARNTIARAQGSIENGTRRDAQHAKDTATNTQRTVKLLEKIATALDNRPQTEVVWA